MIKKTNAKREAREAMSAQQLRWNWKNPLQLENAGQFEGAPWHMIPLKMKIPLEMKLAFMMKNPSVGPTGRKFLKVFYKIGVVVTVLLFHHIPIALLCPELLSSFVITLSLRSLLSPRLCLPHSINPTSFPSFRVSSSALQVIVSLVLTWWTIKFKTVSQCSPLCWSPNSTVLHLDINVLWNYANLKDTAGQSAPLHLAPRDHLHRKEGVR